MCKERKNLKMQRLQKVFMKDLELRIRKEMQWNIKTVFFIDVCEFLFPQAVLKTEEDKANNDPQAKSNFQLFLYGLWTEINF